MEEKLTLGISSCLLGNEVRYNGQHKLNRYLRDILGRYVNYYPVCPEVECGLPVPREAMHLSGDPDNPRLVTVKTDIDHTDRMGVWAENKLDDMEKAGLCGFIFKTKSPSSGLRDIKVYNGKSIKYNGVGLFAKAFTERFPHIPVEDDGRLNDPGIRENFIQQIFIYHRWQLINREPKMKNLVDFHTRHKLIIMSRNQNRVSELGALVAHGKDTIEKTFEDYFLLLMDTLKIVATPKNHANVLYHIMGYFKKELTGYEKEELVRLIELYRTQKVPLIAPMVLINHYTGKYNQPYLQGHYYLNPHPAELMLLNHV